MEIKFAGSGTAEEVSRLVDEAAKAAALEAKTPEEAAGAEAIFDGIGLVLASVDGDRQSTVVAQGAVTDVLTRVYLDIAIVPSGAVQEAAAEADRVNVRQPAAPSVDEHLAEE